MPNSEIILWITQGVIIAFLAFEKAYKLINSKKNNKANHSGNNPHPCAAHGERLARVETEVGNLKTDNTQEHGVIFRAIEKLNEKLDKRSE